MKGIARSTFWRNRLGFCVLHPAGECRGVACEIEHPDGRIEQTFFPEDISPNQPYTEIRMVAHQIRPGLWFKVGFEGELFEMEDQRNWSDYNFKIYSSPLHLPYPVKVAKGTVINQSIIMTLFGDEQKLPKLKFAENEQLTLAIQPETTSPLPRIGLGLAGHGVELDHIELKRLRQLNLNHLRVDLVLNSPAYGTLLHQAWRQAQAVGASLEIGLIFSEHVEAELADLDRTLLEIKPQVGLWLVFRYHERLTPLDLVEIVRPHLLSLYPAVPVGGGAKAYYADLNRNRAIHSRLDVISYSLNPQVHVTDTRSMMESLPAQAEMVRSARQWIGTQPLAVTPVTLKPRFNPITGKPFPWNPGELPSMVDERQALLPGAIWTLGSLKYLCESGVDSVTYYETTGWLGVMETTTGSPLPGKFPSFPGCVFPLFHVLVDLGEFSGGELVRVASSNSRRIAGFALRKEHCLRLLLANLSETKCNMRLSGMENPFFIRFLDEITVENAMKNPDEWRSQPDRCDPVGTRFVFDLLPYSIAAIDTST
jgi:hypothetical protein